MKRTAPLFTLLGLAAVLVPLLAVLGNASPPTSAPARPSDPVLSAPPTPATTRACPAQAPSANEKVVGELVALLRETRSPDTFLVTVMVLGRMGAEARPAIPDIIRNAERLNVFKDVTRPAGRGDELGLAEGVWSSIEMILDGSSAGRTWIRRTPVEPGYYGSPAASYGSPVAYPPSPACSAPPPPPTCTSPAPADPPPCPAPPPPPPDARPRPVKPAKPAHSLSSPT
jgi:hypothetical protein